MTTFDDAVRAARAIEAVENYSRADAPLDRGPPLLAEPPAGDEGCGSDGLFWGMVSRHLNRDADGGWGRRFHITSSFLTGWIARVPGLFWSPVAKAQRARAEAFVESQSEARRTYTPVGKSGKVAGGIGTLRLPTDAHGYRLATLSCGINASSGIPVLVSPDLWDQATRGGPAEGRHIDFATGRWQQMGLGWSERFEAVKGIPQGYLVVERWHVADDHGPVQFHPFAVMEYETEHSLLYDFVYDTVDLGDENWRADVETFFESYRTRNGRNGRYLTAADSGDRLWEAEYGTPKDLRKQSQSGRTNLDLLTARLQERLAGRDVIESTMARLSAACAEVPDLTLYSHALDIQPAMWLRDARLADNVNAFVAEVQRRPGKMEELIHRLDVTDPPPK